VGHREQGGGRHIRHLHGQREWAGNVHPHQALRKYRDWSGIDARLVVVGLTATDFTIADPADPGMLDIAGFDSALPTLLTDFSAHAI
jgi:60 kDa SS-A/Ro ribonucleoprotein